MNCCDCVFFCAGIFTGFCALVGDFLCDWYTCPDFRESISCYKVNKNVNGKEESICDI